MLRLALIGDIHLHASSPRYAHTLEVLDWTIADALARGATGFVFLGDVVEQAPAPMEIADLAQRFGAIADGGAWAAVVQGNHEHADCGAIWECLGVTCAWDRFRSIDGGDAVVLLLPFPRRGRSPYDHLLDDGTIAGNIAAARTRITDAVEAYREQYTDRPLIVCGHFTCEGMRVKDSTFEVHSASEVVVPRTAFAGVALAACGHIHTPQDVSADPPIIGVGSLIRHSFSEARDEKSYTLVTIIGGSQMSWERVPVPCREMREEYITWRSDMDRASVEHEASLGVYTGHEVKLVVEIPADQVATFDPSMFDAIKARAALFVLEKRVIPVERVRAPQLGASGRLEDEVRTWLDATGAEVDEARRARVMGKVAEVAQ